MLSLSLVFLSLLILFVLFWYRKPIVQRLKLSFYQARRFSDIYLLSTILFLLIFIFLFFLLVKSGTYFKKLFLLKILIFFALTTYYYSIKEKIKFNSYYPTERLVIIGVFILVDYSYIDMIIQGESQFAILFIIIFLIQIVILFITRKAVLHYKQRKAHWQAIESDKDHLE